MKKYVYVDSGIWNEINEYETSTGETVLVGTIIQKSQWNTSTIEINNMPIIA